MSDGAESSATAHLAWDRRWQSDEHRALWRDADPEVRAHAEAAAAKGARRVLDLGCGIGRHALALAQMGLQVTGFDGSPAGLEVARAEAGRLGLAIGFDLGQMMHLPYADGAFDHVVAWNVVYHGSPDAVTATLAEVRRVLAPGGTLHATMLSKGNAKYGLGRCVAPDTFVIDGVDDKDHPHLYCDEGGLGLLFAGFVIRDLVEREHRSPGSLHWHLLAERLG